MEFRQLFREISQEDFEDAIHKLGKFEDAYDSLMSSQTQIPLDLEKMRMEGKEKTIRYKEIMNYEQFLLAS